MQPLLQLFIAGVEISTQKQQINSRFLRKFANSVLAAIRALILGKKQLKCEHKQIFLNFLYVQIPSC